MTDTTEMPRPFQWDRSRPLRAAILDFFTHLHTFTEVGRASDTVQSTLKGGQATVKELDLSTLVGAEGDEDALGDLADYLAYLNLEAQGFRAAILAIAGEIDRIGKDV